MKNGIPVYHLGTITELKEKDLLVSRFLPYSEKHRHLHSAHRHSFFHLVLFTGGSGTHSIDFETYPVEPFQIYFMIPGQVHSWNFSSDPDGYVINFSEEYFQSFLLKQDYLRTFPFFQPGRKDSVFRVTEPNRSEIFRMFEDILKEGESDQPFRADYLRVLLLKVFIMLARELPEDMVHQPFSYNRRLLSNFQSLLEVHYKDLRLPREYAELLYITPNHLNALCTDLLGCSAGQLIRNRVALEAKRLLINPDLTIAEIGYQLGFTDNSNFSKFFRKQAGMPPEEFRKTVLKN
ncbi:MAG TPA: helix-turn-helix transcriptional regulator [Sphingobacteriaceae bacterium]